MNFYSVTVTYTDNCIPFDDDDRKLSFDAEKDGEKAKYKNKILDFNKSLDEIWGEEDRKNSIQIYKAKNGELNIIAAINQPEMTLRKAQNRLKKRLTDCFDIKDICFKNAYEITARLFNNKINSGYHNDFISDRSEIQDRLGTDYDNNSCCNISEMMIRNKRLTYDHAKELASDLLADKSMMEELDRIYSSDNKKKYYGNPVHYRIVASNHESAESMLMLLVRALNANGRIIGCRLNRVSEIQENCYDESDIEHLFRAAQGGVVVIEMDGNDADHGNYASAYEEVVTFFGRLIKKYQLNTLFVFVELTDRPGFSKILISKVEEDVDIVEIREGIAKREVAKSFILKEMSLKSINAEDSDIERLMEDKKEFTTGEAYDIVNHLAKDSLKNDAYRAYKTVEFSTGEHSKSNIEPYKQLQDMIGLTEVKRIVEGILDTARIRNLRSKMGLDTNKQSMHMIFTGNPGSAKTTVARIIAEILKKENILETGKYVECGRSDLVGKYVGWTAKAVASKFREAKGGVLFIDEAYSLVDSSGSFGDEAINTIVQEMENHRDDVIVIFAGYPDKMKEFLNKNEGLRSRISFHVNFPDYDEKELIGILELMASKSGYNLDKSAKEKCFEIFKEARYKKEFGNGRFVRNLLEQAEISQASRVIKESKGKIITADTLKLLKCEDFNVNASMYARDIKKIGFCS